MTILSDGAEATSRAVILATGVSWRRLGVPGLEALVGAGVFYGAAASEAPAMRGQEVYVVGGANSAGQAAVHLARYAARVTMLVRGASLAESMSDYLIREIQAAPNIDVRYHTESVDGHAAPAGRPVDRRELRPPHLRAVPDVVGSDDARAPDVHAPVGHDRMTQVPPVAR